MKAATGSEAAGAAEAGALLAAAAAAGAAAGPAAAAFACVGAAAAAAAAAGACVRGVSAAAGFAAGLLAAVLVLAPLVVGALAFAAPRLEGPSPSKLNCTTSPLSSTHALTCCDRGFWQETQNRRHDQQHGGRAMHGIGFCCSA